MKAVYQWRVGDVFTDGTHRWAVVSVYMERAVLQSCTTYWAKTIALTYEEWNDRGQWQLEAV